MFEIVLLFCRLCYYYLPISALYAPDSPNSFEFQSSISKLMSLIFLGLILQLIWLINQKMLVNRVLLEFWCGWGLWPQDSSFGIKTIMWNLGMTLKIKAPSQSTMAFIVGDSILTVEFHQFFSYCICGMWHVHTDAPHIMHS